MAFFGMPARIDVMWENGKLSEGFAEKSLETSAIFTGVDSGCDIASRKWPWKPADRPGARITVLKVPVQVCNVQLDFDWPELWLKSTQ